MTTKLFLSGVTGFLLIGCASPDPPARPATVVVRVSLKIPDQGDKAVLAKTFFDAQNLETRLAYNDTPGVTKLIEAGRVIVTEPADGKVTDQIGVTFFRVRLTSGDYTGQEFWVLRECIVK